MIECRHCRQFVAKPVEKIGARCPTCRLPLFEKERPRAPVVDLGPCAWHANNSAVAKCQRCGKMMCAPCRTRWYEEIVCSSCLDQFLQKGPASPRLVQAQQRQAHLSLVFAFMAWAVLLLTAWPLAALFRGSPDRNPATLILMLFFGSFFFALYAVGQAAACLRMRSRGLTLAIWGLALAGAHLGLCLGLVVLNIWHH